MRSGPWFQGFPKKQREFLARNALEKQKADGIEKKLCILGVKADVMVYGNEAICNDGEVVGVSTGGNFGHTVGHPLVYSYLPKDIIHQDDPKLTIEVLGQTHDAFLYRQAPYDPKMERLKA